MSQIDLTATYISQSGLQKEMGCAYVTAKSILDDAAELGDVMTFEGKPMYNRTAVAKVLKERNAKLLGFLSALEGDVSA